MALTRRARERRQPRVRRARACWRRSRSAKPTPASSTRRTRSTVPGKVTVLQAAGLGAAEGRSTAIARRHREPEPGRGAGVRHEAARKGGAGDARRGRLPAAASSTSETRRRSSRSCFAATLHRARVPRCCRSSRSSRTSRRCTLIGSSRTRSSTTRCVVSAEDDLVAQALVLLVGTPTAYLLATRRFRGRVARPHARRAAARPAARRRRHRPARRVRPHGPAAHVDRRSRRRR